MHTAKQTVASTPVEDGEGIPALLRGPKKARQHRCRSCGAIYPSEYRVCPRDATPLGGDGSARDPLLGTIVGATYRLKRVLASGGMGRLYEADHVRINRRFAVKVMHSCYASEPAALKRFEREVRAVARIRSDYVVDVVDVLQTVDGRPCIVSELLEGEDLQRRLNREGPLPFKEALRLSRHICRGLSAAHARGIVHRDLKPSNVFLTRGADGRAIARLLDFGVAKFDGAAELTKDGVAIGTPAYMSPEQARGESTVAFSTDIYGVGALLYRMITGRPPYMGSDSATILRRVHRAAPEAPSVHNPAIPASLDTLVQRAMDRSPESRHGSAMALEGELARLLMGAPRNSVPLAVRSGKPQARGVAIANIMSFGLGIFAGLEIIAGLLTWWLDATPPIGVALRIALAAALASGLVLQRAKSDAPSESRLPDEPQR